MKKIASFLTAFVLFILIIVGIHFSVSSNLDTNNKEFHMWINSYKNLSVQALSQNFEKDTMLILGSSEFNHGMKTPFHPTKIFKKQPIDCMIIGEAYKQCLNDAITLGSVESSIKNRKVIIVLSPTWFYKRGITPERYSLRFSESQYMAFMENRNITKKIKEYVADRTKQLLATDPSMLNRVNRCNNIYIYNDSNPIEKLVYNIRKTFVLDKDKMAIEAAMNKAGIKTYNKFDLRKGKMKLGIKWNKKVLLTKKNKKSKYYMTNYGYNKTIKGREKISIGMHSKDRLDQSPEYKDLESFLQVCKACNIKPMIIIQPLNGYWYDATGMKKKTREKLNLKVKEIAKKYNAKVDDFIDQEYSKNYFEDAVHPTGEGWIKLNEKIYEFYKEN